MLIYRLSALLTILFFHALAHSEQKLHNVVAGDKVRLRATPSTEGEIVTTMARGAAVEYVEWGKEWVKVKLLDENKTGWMHQDYWSSWLVSDVETKGIQFADIAERGEPHWALLGQFNPGAPVVLLGGAQPRTAITDKLATSVNVATDGIIHETTLRNVSAGSDDNIVLGIVGKGSIKSLTLNRTTDSTVIAALADLSRGKNSTAEKGYIKDFTMPVEAHTASTPLGELNILLHRIPEDTPAEYAHKSLIIVCGDNVHRMSAGCPGSFQCFTFDGTLYLAFHHGNCESGDYNNSVYQLTKAGIVCVYTSVAFGC